MIDTNKLRRQFPIVVAEQRNTIVSDLHNVCDELDRVREEAKRCHVYKFVHGCMVCDKCGNIEKDVVDF